MKSWDVRIWDVKVRRCDASAKMRCECEDAMRTRRCKMQIGDVRMFGPVWHSKTQDVANPVLLHANTFTQKQFYAQSLWHTILLFTHKHTTVHTQTLLHICAHTLPLHSKVLTHNQIELSKTNLLDGAFKGKSSWRSFKKQILHGA